MKLRIRGNSLRLRLSQSEMQRLADTGAVRDSIRFGGESRLDYAVEVGGDALRARYAAHRIVVTLPATLAARWAQPAQVGLQAEQPLGGGESLVILLEKDYACLTPRPGEEDRDAFPNPAAED